MGAVRGRSITIQNKLNYLFIFHLFCDKLITISHCFGNIPANSDKHSIEPQQRGERERAHEGETIPTYYLVLRISKCLAKSDYVNISFPRDVLSLLTNSRMIN